VAIYLQVMEVDRDSPVPVWRQVAGDVRRRIDTGELRSTVPGVHRLAQEYGIATATAAKVLRHLVHEEVVVAVVGKGHYVRQDPPSRGTSGPA
jgi:DNA-binding GntR family transcriptional regulator